MREVRLRLSQKQIPRRSIIKISKVIKNSPRKDMCPRGVPLGYERSTPRGQSHNIGIIPGAQRTSTVRKMTGHFRKSAKRSKNEQNEPKLEKVNKSQLSGNEKVNKSQPPRKSSKC